MGIGGALVTVILLRVMRPVIVMPSVILELIVTVIGRKRGLTAVRQSALSDFPRLDLKSNKAKASLTDTGIVVCISVSDRTPYSPRR